MRLSERLSLLKAGYSKKEIEEMVENETKDKEENETKDKEENENNEKETKNTELEEALEKIKKLEEDLTALQLKNINSKENEKETLPTSAEAWASFFGEKEEK